MQIEADILHNGIKAQSSDILYKTGSSNTIKSFKASEIDSVYQSATFDLKRYSDTLQGKSYLISVLAKGRINLYGYFDGENYIEILEKNGEQYRVSKYKTNIEVIGELPKKDKRFRGVFFYAMKDSETIQSEISQLNYNLMSAKSLVDKYNLEFDIKYKKEKRIITSISIEINSGLNLNQNRLAYYTNFKDEWSSYLPSPTAGIESQLYLHEKLRFDMGLSLFQCNAEFKNFTDDGVQSYNSSMNFSFLDFPLQLNYFLIDRKISLSVNIGFFPGLVIQKQFEQQNLYFDRSSKVNFPLSPLKFGYKYGLGIHHNKFSFYPSYYFGTGREGVNAILLFKGYELIVAYRIFN